MHGGWLFSYLVLWLVAVACAGLLIGVLRQIGILHLEIARQAQRMAADPIELDVARPVSDMVAFDGKDLVTGRRLAAADLLGSPAVVLFVAPACEACQHIAELVETIAPAHPDRSFVFISAGGRYRNREFIRRHNIRLPVITDPHGDMASRNHVTVTPTMLLADADGVVRQLRERITAEDLLAELPKSQTDERSAAELQQAAL